MSDLLPEIVPPISLEPSGQYLLVIKDANNIYHYFNHDGSYDGWSKEIIPVEDNPN